MSDAFSAKDFATLLNLRDDEAETLKAVVSHCAKVGIATGGAGAVGMAGAGAVVVPGVGAVPGWLVGFAAGWVGGTLVCTMAHRFIVIEALKQTLSDAGQPASNDWDAIGRLRSELARAGNPERPVGYRLPG